MGFPVLVSVKQPRSAGRHLLGLLLVALAFTLLDAVKPLTIDDAAYYYYAAQVAERPLDPYTFRVFWWYYPEPANHVLAPPVLPYWWGLGIRLFGASPFLWKLWLLPFSLLFVGSLDALARRFAAGLEMPLVLMTVLSPAFLPSLNLMLDVPALALSLTALVLFFRACDRGAIGTALLAGLAAGLAMETKYTGFLAPAAMVLYAVVHGKRSVVLALVAVLLAVLLFVGWEWLMEVKYGVSHFAYHFNAARGDRPVYSELLDKVYGLGVPLFTLLGAVAPALALLGLAALRRGYRTLLEVAAAIVIGYVLVAGFGSATIPAALHKDLFGPIPREGPVSLEQAVFTLLGIGTAVVVLGTAWSLCEPLPANVRQSTYWVAHREAWFLLLWLGLEVAGYFALTPFNAVRRILGVVVVANLLVGCLAARTCLPEARRVVYAIVAASMALGMLFWGVDVRDAYAEKGLAEGAARKVQEDQLREGVGTLAGAPGIAAPAALPWGALPRSSRAPTVWYVGHWGFQYYAERARMVPVVPDQTVLHTGDWLVVPDSRITQQPLDLDRPLEAHWLQPTGVLAIEDPVPLRTIMGYYGTATGVPLQHLEGPRVTVTIYRVTHDFVAPQG